MKLFKIIRLGKSLDDLKIAASYINVSLETRDSLDTRVCISAYVSSIAGQSLLES
jgi:hypothetical protein